MRKCSHPSSARPRPSARAARLTLALVFACVPLLGSLRSADAATASDWDLSPPLAREVARAKQQGQLLLIKVGTVWCPSCRKLDEVLEEPSVRRGLSAYRRLAYDAEQGEGRDLAERYNVVVYPTLLLVGNDGREIGRLTGALSGQELLAELSALRSGAHGLSRLEQQAKQRPADLGLRLRLGRKWAYRGFREPAARHLQAVRQGGAENQQGLAAEALLTQGDVLLLRSLRDFAAASGLLGELRSRYPSSPQAEQAILPLARALHRLGKGRQALDLLSQWAKSAEQHEAVAWFCLREGTAYPIGLRHALQAVKLAPRRAAAWANLAELQLRLGRSQQATASWDRARALDPDNPRTRGPLPLPPL